MKLLMQHRSPGDLQTGIWNCSEKEETKNENQNEKEESQVDYQKADSTEVTWSYLKDWMWHGYCAYLVDACIGPLHTTQKVMSWCEEFYTSLTKLKSRISN
jgi:hypothetical protein